MYYCNNQLIYSPSDLTVYLESEFASWMDHLALIDASIRKFKDADDPMTRLMGQQGQTHELKHLNILKAKGYSVTDIQKAHDPEEATKRAIEAGEDVIYQAYLTKNNMKGQADFLIKMPGVTDLGNHGYIIRETKLSRTVKPEFIIQLCAYADMMATMQNTLAERVEIVLGNQEIVSFHTRDYFYYYHKIKQSFIDFHTHFDADRMPDPFIYTSYGQWSSYAQKLLVQKDHLLQVADITRKQIQRLNQAGIFTMKALAETSLTDINGIQSSTFDRLKAQADLQHRYRHCRTPAYQLRTHLPGTQTGLAMLPPPSLNDVFFDIEGDPLVEGGLEYLWGSVFFNQQGERCFKDFWAHNHNDEEKAFEDFIIWIYQRWQDDPTMHVYHYAGYEITAIRKLMQRSGRCELQVDALLRNRVFIDLYKVVKTAMLISEPSYSIKHVERLYRSTRQTEVERGDDSVVVYESWRAQPDGDSWHTSELLTNLRDYNRDDCESTQELVAWLRARQHEHGIDYEQPDLGNTQKAHDKQAEKQELYQQIAQTDDKDTPADEKCIRALLAYLSGFHDREKKPEFWLYFERLEADAKTLYDDPHTLAVCQIVPLDDPSYQAEAKGQKTIYKLVYDADEPFRGDAYRYTLTGIEDEKGQRIHGEKVDTPYPGVIYLKMKTLPLANDIGFATSLVPYDFINTTTIEKRIIEHASNCPNQMHKRNCLTDLLMKRWPRIDGLSPGNPIIPSDTPQMIPAITEAVSRLKHSYLVIQGPPGTGKTYTAKYIIATLLKAGKRIGICSNSHKAIHNLLESAALVAYNQGVSAKFVVTRPIENADVSGIVKTENSKLHQALPSNNDDGCVLGTTVWGFAREEMQNQLDYLFIDEAGQVALANYVAISGCANNMVLLGDQMQLSQPTQAIHPGDSGISVLDYVLKDQSTVAPHQGIFLATSYRMHSSITHFISETFYEGRLQADPANDHQQLMYTEHPNLIRTIHLRYGLVYCPVSHKHNSQSSEEEVAYIEKLTTFLMNCHFIDKNQQSRPLQPQDILYVAPFNYQVKQLKQTLGVKARVGSVDKFQGQQAPVVIISMCSSTIEDSPRGIGFLFDRHRLNVAISRAQTLAIVVASDHLSHSRVKTVEQTYLMNIYCRLMHDAQEKTIKAPFL